MRYFFCLILLWKGLILSLPFPTTISPQEWEIIAPLLLPDNHPQKASLDAIFSLGRPIRDLDSLKKAGFSIITKGHWSDTIIATHSKVDGLFFKMFTEDMAHINEFSRLIARIQGALYAQEIVTKHKWNKLFKIPRKWLYLIPDDPTPIFGIPPKRMILVAEDMRLLSKKESYLKWRSGSLSKSLLKSVFLVLTEGGFSDSCFAFNLPFAKDGRIALIDNDKFNKRPIPFTKLLKYLHSNRQKYAKTLIQEAGPGLAY